MVYESITPENLRILVETFYDKVQRDEVIGPVFTNHIQDWEPHFAKMTRFWSSVMLANRSYKGDPLGAHRGVSGIESHLFDHWLGLFEETVRELYEEELVDEFLTKARRIGDSLKLGLFYKPQKMSG
jgi:hemoglobin